MASTAKQHKHKSVIAAILVPRVRRYNVIGRQVRFFGMWIPRDLFSEEGYGWLSLLGVASGDPHSIKPQPYHLCIPCLQLLCAKKTSL